MTWTANPDTGPPDTDAPDDRRGPVRTGHVRWRRVLLWTLAPVTALFGIGSVVGAGTMALVGAGTGAAALGTFALVRYPHLRHHFAPFGPRWARPQRNRGGHGQRGFSRAWTRNWRKGGSSLRSPFRAGGRGGSFRGGHRRRAGAAFRSPGSGRFRRGSGGSLGLGTGRRRGSGRSGGGSGGFRRGSGRSRGLLRGSGHSRGRAGTGAGGRRGRFSPFRRGSAASRGGPGPRRRLFRPSTWRRRAGAAPRARAGGGRVGSSRSRRRLFRPSTWRRNPRPAAVPPRARTRRRATRPWTWFRRSRAGGGTPRGRRPRMRSTGPRYLRHPSTWFRFRRRTGRARGHRPPAGRARRLWRMIAGDPAYRNGRRMQRASRREARKMHRARVKAWRARRKAAFPPRRRWFTPWRGRPGSHARPGWRARYRRFRAGGGVRNAFWSRYRRFRLRHGRLVRSPHGTGWSRRRMTWRRRIARRWQLRRRMHRGLGIVPHRRGMRLRLAQLRANISSRRNRRRALRKLRGRPLTWRRRVLSVLTLARLRARLRHRGTRVRRPLRERLTRLRPRSGWLRVLRPRRTWLPRRRPGRPPRAWAEAGWLAWARWPLRSLDRRRAARWARRAGTGRHRTAPAVDPEARPARPEPDPDPGTPHPGPEPRTGPRWPLSAPAGSGSGSGHEPGNRTGGGPMPAGTTHPGAGRVDNASAEVASTLGNWTPASGPDIDRTLAVLPEYMDAQRQVFTHMADTLDMHASEHPVTEQLRQAADGFQYLRDTFEHVYQVHRVEHEQGMQRFEAPKPGEATWNVPGGGNGDGGNGHQLVAEAESAVRSRLGSWEPADGADFDSMLARLPDFMTAQQDIFTRIGHHLAASSEPPVVDAMHEAASHFDGAADAFREVYKTHRVEHAWQMKRYEEPKDDENVWNVGG